MIFERCRRCGERIDARSERELTKRYNEHVIAAHGMPQHVGELAR